MAMHGILEKSLSEKAPFVYNRKAFLCRLLPTEEIRFSRRTALGGERPTILGVEVDTCVGMVRVKSDHVKYTILALHDMLTVTTKHDFK